MNIFKKIGIINRVIKFINNVKKHYENSTVDDRAKKCVENFINSIKEFGTLAPELKPEAEWIISEIKKIIGCKNK